MKKSSIAQSIFTGFLLQTFCAAYAVGPQEQKKFFHKLQEQQKRNLRVLREKGATLAIGSDEYDETSAYEADYLTKDEFLWGYPLAPAYNSVCRGNSEGRYGAQASIAWEGRAGVPSPPSASSRIWHAGVAK